MPADAVSELLVAAGPGEWRAAWAEAGEAVELYVERGDVRLAGSIHLGRVTKRSAGLDSAFVEIGDERPGLVPVREARADGVALDEGARVLARVRREAQLGKGARLSTRLSHPNPAGLARAAAGLEPPAQLWPPPGFAAALALRLPSGPARLLCDDRAIAPELRRAFPEAEIRLGEPADWPLDLDAAIEAALSPSLALPGGGSLHFDETRAGLLVDVDTGMPAAASPAEAALEANLAAARAVARQLRLRNIGGGVIVDFVGAEGRARDRVRQALAAALAGDPAGPQVLGWTRLGHLELVRPRRGRSLAEAMLMPAGTAPRPKLPAAIAHQALRALWRAARAAPAATAWRLGAAPAVVEALRGPAAPALRALEARLGRPIVLMPAASPGADFDIAPG